jgi:G3E family GTPase
VTPPAEPIPVLIVAGFLGAGKTTFIRDLIPRLATGPRPPYVILNDYLNASIDAASLQGLGAEIIGISADCVCCDDPTGFIDAILAIPASRRPILMIEANGTTDPYRLIEIIQLTRSLRDRLGPLFQVTLINESRWAKRLPYDNAIERAQVKTASAVVTNRGEYATEAQRARLSADLLELNPRAARLDLDSFFDLLLVAGSFPEPDMSTPIEHRHHHVAVRLKPPTMSAERLHQWLLSLPREILRVKGLARISESEMAYFNRTDDLFEDPRIINTTAHNSMEPCVVFIGPGLVEESLRASFLHPPSQPPAFKLEML